MQENELNAGWNSVDRKLIGFINGICEILYLGLWSEPAYLHHIIRHQ